MIPSQDDDTFGLKVALEEAKKSYTEGGLPIGAALIAYPTEPGVTVCTVLGVGHNERIQKSSAVLHGEMAALENAGRLPAGVYRTCTMYTTLSPCDMCTGAILLYKIPRVVIGENATFKGNQTEELLRSRGVEVVVVDDAECKVLMSKFVEEKPHDWYEDIGEVPERA